nr:MAG TPA: hypothetical protein [Caudoviricetes sp.]
MQIVEVVLHFAIGQLAVDQVAEVVIGSADRLGRIRRLFWLRLLWKKYFRRPHKRIEVV